MKTVLDLLSKYDALNEAKSRAGGKLPPEDEERWEELKVVYELLMYHSGLGESPFSPADIRSSFKDGSQLRVPVDAHAMIHYDGASFDAEVVNLSRRGVFLAADTLPPRGASITIYLAGLSEDDAGGDVLELQGDVVWSTDQGVPEARVQRGMGVRLSELTEETESRLESLVVEAIERRLKSVF